MTIPRQGRRLQASVASRSATSVTAAALLGFGLLVPATASAAPPNHTRHPLPTALHAARLTESTSHPAANGRHGRTAGKTKPGARATDASEGNPATGHKTGKPGKKQKGKNDADDPIVPMYTARHGQTNPRHAAPVLVHDTYTGRHATASRRQLATSHEVPHSLIRPVVAAGHGAPSHSFAFTPGGHSGIEAAPHHWSVPPRTPQPAPAEEARSSSPAPPSTKTPSPVVSPRPEAYAQGTSHPDDDERLPRDRAEMGEDAPVTPAPIARVSAAPTTTSPLPNSSAVSPIVQGFGPEIAVPSSGAPSPGDRPGGTRRRNHPSTWQPESLVTPPEPLEEREAITSAAVSPAVLPEIYDSNGRLLMPAPLKGSHEVLVHQNVMATNDGLQRIYDDNDLERLRSSGQLLNFPASDSLRVNPDLPYNRRVARPWTVTFATDLGHAFYQRFHQPIQVNSAVRTVRYQARLMMINGNAAAISGDAASPHLTGQAVDFAKRGMSQAQLAWMRGYLLPLMQSGKIDVEEEFQQACFHISVYRSYASNRHFAREVAQVHAEQNEAATVEGR